MHRVVSALTILCAGWGVQAVSAPSEPQLADIFANHDCCGRLAHSTIAKIGRIRSGGRLFTIYSLWFVNPQSRHGMKRLAITEDRQFRGSYIISSSAKPTMGHGVVRFFCDNGKVCDGDDFAIKDGKLPARLWLDGEVNNLEETI